MLGCRVPLAVLAVTSAPALLSPRALRGFAYRFPVTRCFRPSSALDRHSLFERLAQALDEEGPDEPLPREKWSSNSGCGGGGGDRVDEHGGAAERSAGSTAAPEARARWLVKQQERLVGGWGNGSVLPPPPKVTWGDVFGLVEAKQVFIARIAVTSDHITPHHMTSLFRDPMPPTPSTTLMHALAGAFPILQSSGPHLAQPRRLTF